MSQEPTRVQQSVLSLSPWGEPIDLLMLARKIYEQQAHVQLLKVEPDLSKAASLFTAELNSDRNETGLANYVNSDHPRGTDDGLMSQYQEHTSGHQQEQREVTSRDMHSSVNLSSAADFLNLLAKLPDRWNVEHHPISDVTAKQDHASSQLEAGIPAPESSELRHHLSQTPDAANGLTSQPQDALEAAGSSLAVTDTLPAVEANGSSSASTPFPPAQSLNNDGFSDPETVPPGSVDPMTAKSSVADFLSPSLIKVTAIDPSSSPSQPLPDAPLSISTVLQQPSTTALSPLQGQGAVQEISDNHSCQPFSAIVSLATDAAEQLSITVALDQPGNGLLTDTVGGSYNSILGIYTVSGSDAEVTAALNALTFQPTAHEVTPGQSVTTNLSLTVNDGHGGSTFSSTSIVATAADDAPVITGNLPSVAVSDASSVQPFAAVQVTDVDVGKIETVTVALDQPGNGLLTDTVGGSYNSALGIYTVSGSDAEVTAALNALTFQPTAHEVTPGQSVTTNLSLTVNDGHGGSTFSSTSIVATAADDAPVITGNLPSVAVSDASSVQPFAAVQVTDVDVGKIETVTVALDQPGNGLLTDTVGGTYHPVLGIYTVSGSAAEITADLEALTFQPKAHEVTPGQSVTTDFTLTVNDGRGGSGVMSTSVVATATDDAPIITGGQTAETVPLGTALKPFSSVRIVDVDFGKVETATVSLSTLSGVVLTNLSSGSYDPSLGIYTVSGTASAVSKALQDLVLRPITHEVTAGTELQTTLTLTVSDGQGGSSTLNTTVVMASPEYNAKNLAMSMQGGAESLSLASPASNDNFSAKQSISVSLGSTDSPKMTPTGSEGLLTKSTDPQLLNVQDTNDPRGDTLELARADAGVSSTASVSGPDRVSNSSHPQQRVDRYGSTFHLPGLHQTAEHSIPVPSQEHIGALRDALLSGRTGLENTFTSGRAGIQCNSIPYPDPQPLSETQVHLRSLLVKSVWTPSSPASPHSAEVLMEVTDHEGLQPHAGLHSEHSTFDHQHSIDHAHQQSWVGLHNHH